jgi:hypothetical protein
MIAADEKEYTYPTMSAINQTEATETTANAVKCM